jgi:hypothetical protein
VDSAPSVPGKVEKEPTLLKLLNGDLVTYTELERLFGTFDEYEGAFEEFVKYHRFNKGDTAIVKFEVDPTVKAILDLKNKVVTIDGFEVFKKTGTLAAFFYYKVKETEGGRAIPIPARNLWRSEAEYEEGIRARATVVQEKRELNEAYAAANMEERQRETFLAVHTSPEIVGQTQFQLNQRVRIEGVPTTVEGHADLNGQRGFIAGNEIKKAGGRSILIYFVTLETGPLVGQTKRIPYNKLIRVDAGGKRKVKTSKRRKQRKQTRKASK